MYAKRVILAEFNVGSVLGFLGGGGGGMRGGGGGGGHHGGHHLQHFPLNLNRGE
jgi:hypothetical protein